MRGVGRRDQWIRDAAARTAHAPVGFGERIGRFREGDHDRGHAVGDPFEPPCPRHRSDRFAFAVALRAQAFEQREQRRPVRAGLGEQPLLQHGHVHLEFARPARRASQATRLEPRVAPGVPAGGRGPHSQCRLQPARCDAQVVHGVGVATGPRTRRGRAQRGGAAQQLLAGGPDGRCGHGCRRSGRFHHAVGAGRPWATSAATRSHNSSEMSSTLRVASSVVNAYSCESASSSRIMRRW